MSVYSCVNTTMKQFEESVCMKYRDDPCECIDCEKPCEKGKETVEKLEKETKKVKILTRKEQSNATMKITAMTNYLEAMAAADPIKFVMEKYGSETDRAAKNKIYQWQHNYGTNLFMVAEKVKLLKEEVATSQAATAPKKTALVPKKPEEEKKMTKRQEQKISQSHLEQLRSDLESEYLKMEAEIEAHKKGIVDCEKRIEAITTEVQAIRQVLEIFKAKDALYA